MMDLHLCQDIGRTALALVADERDLQIVQKGYVYAHDDEHVRGEIAAAAAFYLLPASLNPHLTIGEISEMPAWSVAELAGAEGPLFGAEGPLFADDDPPELDLRIEAVTRGVALGLAELERLMRMREAQGARG